MTLKEYQQEAVKFRTPESDNAEYLHLGLVAEVGEVAGKLAKKIRDGAFDEKAFIKELGDVLWFVANIAEKYGFDFCVKGSFYSESEIEYYIYDLLKYAGELYIISGFIANQDVHRILKSLTVLADKYGYTLEDVAEINIAKLRDRQFRGVINGNGDER